MQSLSKVGSHPTRDIGTEGNLFSSIVQSQLPVSTSKLRLSSVMTRWTHQGLDKVVIRLEAAPSAKLQ
jgi:hypothetical protein